ncbi:MAG: ABC transporter permease [Oscillospiraceae bacterium]|nr:ABC transporter permease [Oscillospiraceae bacterium]
MGIWDNIFMALASIRSNKMRSLLTMLGIIIGIGAVIAIQTVGNSLTSSLSDSMSSFGATNISVSVTAKDSEDTETFGGFVSGVNVRMFGPATPSGSDLISDAMVEEYRAAFPDKVQYIEISESVGSASMTSETDLSTTVTATLTGVNPDYQDTQQIECIYGRFLNQEDLDGEKMLAVVADQFVTDALDCTPVDSIGKSFRLTLSSGGANGQNSAKVLEFYIIGVYQYEEENYSSGWGGSDEVITSMYIPLTTAKKINGSDAGYESFTVIPASGTDVESFLDVTGAYFSSYYTRNESFTVEASSMASMLEEMTSMLSTVSLAISAIAAIALLVGGIGVMNIMTVSVTERTREIGTRKALGAPGSAIRLQFIVEAMVICLIGGLIGVGVGLGLGAGGAMLLGYSARPSATVIVLAVAFSMGIGVFFGYYPANKAARMNPIDALRYE